MSAPPRSRVIGRRAVLAAAGLLVAVLVLAPYVVMICTALKPGDSAPNFSARASLAGKEFDFSLQDALKKGPVVVYFYPSAYTKGCDLEVTRVRQRPCRHGSKPA